MRKRNVNFCLDSIIWAVFYSLPVIFYALSFIAYDLTSVSTLPTFATFIQENFNILSTNIIYTGLVDLFGSNGILPLLDTTSVNGAMLMFTWFILSAIIHLACDFLLFIPRISHKFLGKLTEE